MSSSAIARLRPHLAAVVEQLERFARVKREHVADVVEILRATEEAAAGRAQAAQERSHERSEAIRSAIRAEIERLTLERAGCSPRELTALVHRSVRAMLRATGRKRGPDLRTVRDEIALHLKLNVHFGTETTLSTRYRACVAST